ncbi:craniofacial development protein 2-like [Amphiura filiformis]|uniref:craniofacial development protein 2-like n=1 Tax=Amphiura filiformis TaxID=82378 RepID=UPI003B213BA3
MTMTVDCIVLQYADDSALMVSDTCPEKIAKLLSKNLEKCNQWLIDNKLSLHMVVRWTGKGNFSLDNGRTIYYSGSDRLKRSGVGFILSRETAKRVLGYNPISDRLITIRLQARPVNISVVQAYAPTSTADDETINSFFHELQETINKILTETLPSSWGISMPKLEMTWLTMMPLESLDWAKLMREGERLADFCNENELIVTNTLFQQHPRRLYTWISPDGRTRNQINYILIKRRWRSSVKVAKTYPGADCGSDHQLLVAEIRSKLKSVKRDTPSCRYDVNRINEQYRVEVRNSFQILNLYSSAEQLAETKENPIAMDIRGSG